MSRRIIPWMLALAVCVAVAPLAAQEPGPVKSPAQAQVTDPSVQEPALAPLAPDNCANPDQFDLCKDVCISDVCDPIPDPPAPNPFKRCRKGCRKVCNRMFC